MASPIKKVSEDQTNAKIQEQFDSIFIQSVENNLAGSPSMSSGAQKKDNIETEDFQSIEMNIALESPILVEDNSSLLMEISPRDEIALDFEQNDTFELETSGSSLQKEEESTLDNLNISDEIENSFDAAIASAKMEINGGTSKTILFDKSQLASFKLSIDDGDDKDENEAAQSFTRPTSSTDNLIIDDDKTNIDKSFINSSFSPEKIDPFEIEDNISFSELSDIADDEKTRIYSDSLLSELNFNKPTSDETFDEFDLNNEEISFPKELSSSKIEEEVEVEEVEEVLFGDEEASEFESKQIDKPFKISSSTNEQQGSTNDEESSRFQATIRQLRIEREELIGKIKTVKAESRELEQDNLTIKAAWDESKIEVSLLRKRHMVAMENINYQLSINEEKKTIAIEQARLSESKREKLEQRVRIDFNQIKQREKELETKLEMLSMDVESRIQSRDQKILELRRKIDALEFNMENVSIKEQKSKFDKRKLEDKLNKIMKTLRHSIKNLEDDIDQASDDIKDDKDNDDYQSGKT